MSDKEIKPIAAKLDCTMIEKARLFPGKKENKKGVLPQYLDIVLVPREDDYGNHYMVVQSVSKAEREDGVKGPILGNAKIIGGTNRTPAPAAHAEPPADGKVPF